MSDEKSMGQVIQIDEGRGLERHTSIIAPICLARRSGL